MKNIAIIFAGGTGQRMDNSEIPKQFIEIDGKPIIIHTLEVFEKSDDIDAIIIASLFGWIDYLNMLIRKYHLFKVKAIVPGGETSQLSIFNGLKKAYELFPKNSVVLIHDGVRPFIDLELIRKNIESVMKNGSAISSIMATETFVLMDDNEQIKYVPSRNESFIAKAPQSFVLEDIFNVHLQAQKDSLNNFIDSCTLMTSYGKNLFVVMTDYDNIKITTQKDITLAASIYERRLNKENNHVYKKI